MVTKTSYSEPEPGFRTKFKALVVAITDKLWSTFLIFAMGKIPGEVKGTQKSFRRKECHL